MVSISCRWWNNAEFILVFACVFPESQLLSDRIELDIDNIIDIEREALVRRVVFFDGVGPGVSVS